MNRLRGRGEFRLGSVSCRQAAPLLGALLAVGSIVGAAVASEPGAAPIVEIRIHYSHYQPSFVTVPVGRPITFVIHNEDPIDHEWIVGDATVHAIHRTGTELHHGARPTEVSIPAGGTVTTVVTFPTRASLLYICHLPGHEAYGMVGTIDIR